MPSQSQPPNDAPCANCEHLTGQAEILRSMIGYWQDQVVKTRHTWQLKNAELTRENEELRQKLSQLQSSPRPPAP